MNEKTTPIEDALMSPQASFSAGHSSDVVRTVRTFEDDIADAVRDGKGSILGVALAEQKRKDGSTQYILEKKSSTNYFTIAIVLLVISLAVGGVALYSRFSDSPLSLAPATTVSYIHPFLQADKVSQIDMNAILPKNGIKESLLYSIGGSDLSSNTIRLLLPTVPSTNGVTLATTNDVVARLAPNMPDNLKRTLSQDYALGIFAGDIAEPFIVLKTNSYENAFSGLLSWEDYMSDDLFTFMGVVAPSDVAPAPITDGSASSTSTSTTSTAVDTTIDTTKFVDRTIKNRDLRALQDKTGKIYFTYGFADRNTIIITTSPESYFEVLGKLH